MMESSRMQIGDQARMKFGTKFGTRPGIAGRIEAAVYRFEQMTKLLQSPLLLAARLIWGWQFTLTGWGKLQHLSHVRDFFASLGIPAPGITAPAIATLEFVGGILLIVGLATRLTGLLLACNMLTAYLTTERQTLGTLLSNDPSKFYNADPFTFLMTALLVLAFGAGVFSLDCAIGRWRSGRAASRDV
jgi:putative oxidoreductase